VIHAIRYMPGVRHRPQRNTSTWNALDVLTYRSPSSDEARGRCVYSTMSIHCPPMSHRCLLESVAAPPGLLGMNGPTLASFVLLQSHRPGPDREGGSSIV
jgi:hypothetical protein